MKNSHASGRPASQMSSTTTAMKRKTRNNKTILTSTGVAAEVLSLKFPGTTTNASNSKRVRIEGGATSEMQSYKDK